MILWNMSWYNSDSQSHTYASTGTYTVGVMVTNSVGKMGSANNSVTVVTPGVTPTATFVEATSTTRKAAGTDWGLRQRRLQHHRQHL